jgi:bacillithiol biosynthesis deacetylase BshB1
LTRWFIAFLSPSIYIEINSDHREGDCMELDILAIGAHPDDVELCCGGTLAKAVTAGYRVGILDLTEGELGTRGSRSLRLKEARNAAQYLGVRMRENLRLPDGNIRVDKESTRKLMQVIRACRPKILLIPYSQERHPDHVNAHHLCRETWFYSGLSKIATRRNGKLQEPWRPHACYQFMQWFEFPPSFVVDISDLYDKRMKAILAYSSQFYNPRSREPQTMLSQKSFLEFVEARARQFGGRIGVRYGEPFFTPEVVGIRNLFDLQIVKGS